MDGEQAGGGQVPYPELIQTSTAVQCSTRRQAKRPAAHGATATSPSPHEAPPVSQLMAATDLVLRWVYPPEEANADRRTFQISQIVEGSTEAVEMYRFHHPNTGTNTGVTAISRKNAATQRWENAGQIEWLSDHTANVFFGTERVHMRELRKMKKQSSKSRRFKAGGSDYKWKQAENGKDLLCVSTSLRGKDVATWSADQATLRVTDRGEGILDRVVVTCFLNSWMNGLNLW